MPGVKKAFAFLRVCDVPDVTRQKMAIGARHRLFLRACVSALKSCGQAFKRCLFFILMSPNQGVALVDPEFLFRAAVIPFQGHNFFEARPILHSNPSPSVLSSEEI
jgi:hypothetical protein